MQTIYLILFSILLIVTYVPEQQFLLSSTRTLSSSHIPDLHQKQAVSLQCKIAILFNPFLFSRNCNLSVTASPLILFPLSKPRQHQLKYVRLHHR